ncbi:sugar porter family MFS transporter [Sulfurisphaera tokodaii]|uniref:Sugar porter family MFS transporter n=1 Tax=Sulfurisphaera tokodaii TaxID=111955 RepID=A0A832WDL6_9CREN|nr:sugar porter family MFS transporter [Sulfurisphaera tokodaii]HII73143.1 sugar porter family MFS transporter [Sulfurisphaera tokodaii]
MRNYHDNSYEEVVKRLDNAEVIRLHILATIIGALGGFLFGYDTGIIGSVLVYVTPLFHLTPPEVAILTSGTSLLAGIGALAAGPITDKYGRKSLLVTDGIMYAVFALLSAIAINSFLLILWRSLVGFAIGADTAIATAYISEFSPKRWRGRLAITQQLMIFSGITASFWAGYLLSFSANWRLMLGLGVIPAVILVALRAFLPESPRWLLLNGMEEKAKNILRKFGVNIAENEHIAAPSKELSFKEMFNNKAIRTAIILVGLWLAFQQITGINVILYYGPTIYKYLGLTGPRAILNTAISESLGAIEYAISFYLIDKWGRRKLGIFGYAGLVGSLAIMLIGLRAFTSGIVFAGVALVFTAMTLFLLFFHVGVGGVGWVLQGETIPTEVRGRGAGLLAAIDWFANFVIIFIFPYWKAAFGVYSFFALELVLSILAIAIVYLFMPETKGVSLEDMLKVFERGLSVQRQKQYAK